MQLFSATGSRLKNLRSYSVLAGSFLAGSGAIGQVVYTNIADTTIDDPGEMLQIDLDNNGSTDITFAIDDLNDLTNVTFTSTEGGSFSGGAIYFNHIYAMPAAGNALMGEMLTSATLHAYPFALLEGDTIDATKTFQNSSNQALAYSRLYKIPTLGGTYYYNAYDNGNWFGGQTDKYIGIRFTGAAVYYGWIRCDVSSDNKSITVKDYAYFENNDMIIAGQQSGLAVKTLTDTQVSVYSYGNTIHIQLHDADLQNVHVRIFDLAGRQVTQAVMKGSSASLVLKNAATANYLIRIDSGKGYYEKQLFITGL